MNLIKKLRDALAARRILSGAIRDIEAGKWICGNLARFYDLTGRQIHKYSNDSPAFLEATKYEGCAMGLVAINAGAFGDDGFPNYVSDNFGQWESIPGALKSVEVLANIANLMRGEEPGIRGSDEDTVISYNDNALTGCMTAAGALAWFKAARSSVLGLGSL